MFVEAGGTAAEDQEEFQKVVVRMAVEELILFVLAEDARVERVEQRAGCVVGAQWEEGVVLAAVE